MSEYNIKLEVFEGPVDLLLHLIEKNKIDIYDIPIAIITEQYLGHLETMEEFNIDIASEFLVMAATLLQIKSRMLLPKPIKITESFEEDDPRQELLNKLLEYRQFKQMTTMLETMKQNREHFFARDRQEFQTKVSLPEGLKVDDLIKAFMSLWESSIDDYSLVMREEFSVQDKMYDIMQLLYKHQGQVEFSQTMIRKGTRTEVIAAFLALLELIKLKRVTVVQKDKLGSIHILLRE